MANQTETTPWRIDESFSNLILDAKGKEVCWVEDREDGEELTRMIVEAVNVSRI